MFKPVELPFIYMRNDIYFYEFMIKYIKKLMSLEFITYSSVQIFSELSHISIVCKHWQH